MTQTTKISISQNSKIATWFRHSRFLPWLLLIVSLFLTYQLWKSEQQSSTQKLQIFFDGQVREITDRISQRMIAYEQIMLGAQGLYNASISVERAEFHGYIAAQRLENNYPGIQGIGFNALVTPAARKQHIAFMQKEGFPGYTIRPEGRRDVYTAIIFLEPSNAMNQRAIGFDTYSDPVRRVAMDLARDSNMAAITGKIKLVQETDKNIQAGVLMFLPVYKNGYPRGTLAERRKNIVGWISAPFRMNDLLSGILGKDIIPAAINIEIFDSTDMSDQNMLYSNNASVTDNTQKVSRFKALKQINVAGRPWLVAIRSLPAFEEPISSGKGYTIAYFGIGVSLLLAVLSYTLLSTRNRALAMAHTMTKELTVLNETLEDRIAKEVRKNREKDISMLHQDKLASIGQLAAGIAHEINTPIQFVGDNIHFMQNSFHDIISLFNILNDAKNDDLLSPAVAKDILSRIRDVEEQIDLDFLSKEIPQAIRQSIDGLQRVSIIVQAMREFSHPGGENKTDMDINKAIESTITLTRSEWKYSAELTTNLAPDLPIVKGYPADFNQVILNLIINAAQALQEKTGKGQSDRESIEISTRQDGNEVEICIRDTGSGIPAEAQSHIFDPFFTTKEVGKGTGQGLAIAYNIIVQKHGGKIFFETKAGEGTAFYIRLPLETTKLSD